LTGAATIAAHPADDRGGRLAHLPALDGIRALAVGLVIAYHLEIDVVRGGFMGVDLFFVLSGFLITTLLLREHARSGAIDFVGFWLRRARRLLPAVFLLLAAVAVAAAWASPFDRDQLRWDILSALGYVANWRFIAAGQSYFQEFAAPSPVQHLWSLAIEEQFYLVWPVIVLAAMSVAAWGRRAAAAVVLTLVAAIAASAVAQAMTFDEMDPTVAYFATHTRSHELLVGALAAVLLERSPRFAGAVRPLASGIAPAALAMILGFAALMSDVSSAYYFGGSLAFSLAAAALIVAVSVRSSGRETWTARLLSRRPLPAIGAISYGLYLWHWPMILWLTPASTGVDGPVLAVLRVAVTLAVAGASFVLVEQPIRGGSIGRVHLGVREIGLGALAGAVVLAGIAVVNTRGAQPLPEFVSNNRTLIFERVPGATGSVGLIGDSVAMSLYPGLAYEAAATSRSLAAAAFPGCPIGEAERVDRDGAPFPFARRCPAAAVSEQGKLVDRHDPDVIVWISARERFDIRIDDVVLQAGSPEWIEAAFDDWDRVLARLTERGAGVILVLPFHAAGSDPAECESADALRDRRCTEPNLATNALRQLYVRWAAGHGDQVTVIDPDPVACPSNPCPDTLAGVTLRSDSVHFTQEGALIVADRLLEMVPRDVWEGH
jgi:peptidoglycan/LPS O-acetylase OafA/YrhL